MFDRNRDNNLNTKPMKRYFLVALLCSLACVPILQAQTRNIEVGVYAGGLFNAGFQSFKVLNPTTGQPIRTIKPTSEANSGVFGARASYRLTERLAAEGTFGFSPAGRNQNPIPFAVVAVLTSGQLSQQAPVPISTPTLRGGNVFLYDGALVVSVNEDHTWRPFLLAGAGAITRTAKIRFIQNPYILAPSNPPNLIIAPAIVPSPNRTDMTLVLGGGVKKDISSRFVIRLEFRDHINKFDQSTVNNLETSLGLFTRF
jgi:hypothetical protein